MARRPEIRLLLDGLAEGFDHRSWHGTNLKGSIRGLEVEEAGWRPRPTRHNIWELIVHAAYWKYAVTRRLTNAPRGGFPLQGSNWFRRPATGTARGLAEDIALLRRMHHELLEAVSRLPAGTLGRKIRGSRYTAAETVRGVATHDIYHAGQIQLLRRLFRDYRGT